MRYLVCVLLCMLLSSCGLFRKIVYIPVESGKDSVYVEKVIERTDTLKIEIPVEKYMNISRDSSHLETSLAVSDAWLDSSYVLHHYLSNKGGFLEKQIVYKDRVIEKKVEAKKEIPVVKEVMVETRVVPGYYRWIHRVFWILVIFLGVFIYLKLK